MIDLTGAKNYFAAGAHIHSHVWSKFNQNQQASAIAQARRILARALGRALVDDEAAYAEGDLTRDEYAVYEQALYILLNVVFPNAEGSAPLEQAVDNSEVDRVSRRDPHQLSLEAIRWLGVNYSRVLLVRG